MVFFCEQMSHKFQETRIGMRPRISFFISFLPSFDGVAGFFVNETEDGIGLSEILL